MQTQNSFPGLLLSLTLMLKSKKTLETSLDLILVRYLILNLLWGEGEGGGGLTGSQFLERGYWGRGGVTGDFFQGGGVQFLHKSKIKS